MRDSQQNNQFLAFASTALFEPLIGHDVQLDLGPFLACKKVRNFYGIHP
jgi:hypothetical protein